MTPSSTDSSRTKAALEALVRQLSEGACQELAAIRTAFDQQIVASLAALAEADRHEMLDAIAQDLTRASTEQVEAAAAHARHDAEAEADRQLTAARAAAQERLESEAAANATLREELAATERQLDALRGEAAALETTRTTLETHLEDALAAKARLAEEETRQRHELTEMLEQARETARRATAETETSFRATSGQLLAMKETQQRLEAEIQALRSERRRDLDADALARIGDSVRAFDAATSVGAVLGILVAQLGQAFARAAIFLPEREHSLKGYTSVGVDASINVMALVIPLTDDSVLTQAFRTGLLETVEAPVKVGPFGTPVDYAVAVPVVAHHRVVALAYAEQPRVSVANGAPVDRTFAEILARYAGRCLAGIATPVSSVEPAGGRGPSTTKGGQGHRGPTRELQRAKIREATAMTIDGDPSVLVDLSVHGAQVLSAQALRPNQVVRLRLPSEGGTLACKGEIRWAIFEPSSSGEPLYRAGVKFTHADVAGIELCMARHAHLAEVSPARERPDSSSVA